MIELTENQKSFFRLMAQSLEHTAHGVDALLEKPNYADFFDNISELGFFRPEKIPRSEVAEEHGAIRLRPWPLAEYLSRCAQLAGRREDLELARKVMGVIRATTSAAELDQGLLDNYHIWRVFAEAIGHLPLEVVTPADAGLVGTWLNSRFDRDGVVHELDAGLITRLLESGDQLRGTLAVDIIRYCLRVDWKTETIGEVTMETPVSRVDSYWLHELFSHQSRRLGRSAGSEAARVLRDAVAHLFERGVRAKWSYLFRAAIEEHGQNHEWRSVENAVLMGLRDVVVAWADVAPIECAPFVTSLLSSELQILRRVGIYVINAAWSTLRALYPKVLSPALFDIGHLHELYWLLRNHFEDFDSSEKEATLKVIDALPAPATEDPEDSLRHLQLRWLAALSDTTYQPARYRLEQLLARGGTSIQSHPDFLTYTETSWGHGPSPYAVDELIAFAEEGSLVAKLNGFHPASHVRGASVEALAETFEKAIATAPDTFISALRALTEVLPPYQFNVLNAFRQLWQTADPAAGDWEGRWNRLLAFCDELVRILGSRPADDASTSVATGIADLLQAGTRDDERAYPESLLPRGWRVLTQLLTITEGASTLATDPMSEALNTPKGRATEAAIFHALRTCRVADAEYGSHSDAWELLRPLFDRELEAKRANNFECWTLVGAYFTNFDYMSHEWTRENCGRIFPADRVEHFLAAIDGLGYSQSTRRTHKILQEFDVLGRALHVLPTGRESRKRINERLALAYLWGEESLTSEPISSWFRPEGASDLESVCRLFWTIRDQTLTNVQQGLVAAFLDASVRWAEQHPYSQKSALATFALLVWALPDAEGRHKEILLTLAGSVGAGHATHEFIRELLRLTAVSPASVAEILGRLLDTSEVLYDFEDHLKQLLIRLAESGQRELALQHCNRLRRLAGMADLFVDLKDAKIPLASRNVGSS